MHSQNSPSVSYPLLTRKGQAGSLDIGGKSSCVKDRCQTEAAQNKLPGQNKGFVSRKYFEQSHEKDVGNSKSKKKLKIEWKSLEDVFEETF